MAVLALDTSSAWCSVSILSSPGAQPQTISEGAAGNHFEQLAAIVDRITTSTDTGFDQISRVVVGLGPGSFTGLRIALSYAKGLSWARRIPLLGYSSFEGAARTFRSGEKSCVCVVSDARREEVFLQCFLVGPSEFEPLGEADIVSCAAAVEVANSKASAAHLSKAHFLTTDKQVPHITTESAAKIVSSLSEGLLTADGGAGPAQFSAIHLSQLAPHYVRAVAAQTIEERMAQQYRH